MANTITTKWDSVDRWRTGPGNYTPSVSSQSFIKESKLSSSQTKGQFISIDGNQFRKATDLVKSTCSIIPVSPQVTDYYDLVNGKQWLTQYRTSPGGGRPNLFYETLSCYSSSGASIPCKASQISHLDSMRNEAVTKALLKLADQKINVGENLATLRQTLTLVGGPTKSLVESLMRAWRDKSFRPYLRMSYQQLRARYRRNGGRGSIPKDIADKYLEYVYGWKPLMQDIFTLIELAKSNSQNPLLLNARGSSTRSYYVRPSGFWDASGNTGVNFLSGTDLQTTRCSLWAKISPEYAGLRALNQLGLLNPLSVSWEVMPWSFVVDWLVPIGPVFQALTAPAGLEFVDGTLSTRQRVTCQYKMEYVGGRVNNHSTSKIPATGALKKDSYTRNRLGSWPVPGFWVDTDPLRGDRSFKALALLISNLDGLGRR